MKEQKIYLVYQGDTSQRQPQAVFFSKNEVEKYTKRFKHNALHTIMELTPTKKYVTDLERIPFMVTYGADYDISVGLLSEDSTETIDELLEVVYEINEDGFLYVYLLATDEVDALRQSSEIKEKAIAEGKWDKNKIFDSGY